MSPLARFHKLDPHKREGILSTAAQEFAQLGYEAASLNQIIARSEISKGSFYYYFEDKLDLFAAVVHHYYDPRLVCDWALIGTARTAEEFWDRFHDSSMQSARLAMAEPLSLALGKAFAQIPKELWEQGALGEYIATVMAALGECLVHGQRVGAVRDDLPMSLILQLWMAIDAPLGLWTFERWEEASEPERLDMLEVTLDIYQRVFHC